MRRTQKTVPVFILLIPFILIALWGCSFFPNILPKLISTPFTTASVFASATATRDLASYTTEAEGLFAEGKLAQAIDTYNEAIRFKPDDPSTYVDVARVQVFAGKYDDAQVNAENAMLLDPNNSMAHAVRAWALIQKGDYVAADTSIQAAHQLDPDNGIIQAYKAFLYGGMYENNAGPSADPLPVAIEASQNAVTLAPNNLEAHWARAYILQLTDNPEQAVQEYLLAIRINPNIAELNLCGEALPIAQLLLITIPNAGDAVSNANDVLQLCTQSLGNPTATATP